MRRGLRLALLCVGCVSYGVAWSVPAPRPSTPYTALEGGRPADALPIHTKDIAHVARDAVGPRIEVGEAAAAVRELLAESHELEAPARVWLELANGESLVVGFMRAHDDSDSTCTMRILQSRVCCYGCNPQRDTLRDPGCLTVRWNVAKSEGVLIDLFKAKKGERVGCDISSADNKDIKWGALLLRVVDDIAAALRVKHMYLADESSVNVRVWNARKQSPESATVLLKLLHPLLHGEGYYEHHGYYSVPKDEFYGLRTEDRADAAELSRADDGLERAAKLAEAQAHAAKELDAFNSLRLTPFRDGALASAIAAIRRDGDQAVAPEGSRIHRFALAMAEVQDSSSEGFPSFLAACERADERGRSDVRGGADGERGQGSVARLVGEFRGAIDDELLSAPTLGEMIRILHARNRAVSGGADDGSSGGAVSSEQRAGLEAGGLMLQLMWDLYAVWSPQRSVPLKRKDYHYEGGGEGGPLVQAAYLLPPDPCLEECPLPDE